MLLAASDWKPSRYMRGEAEAPRSQLENPKALVGYMHLALTCSGRYLGLHTAFKTYLTWRSEFLPLDADANTFKRHGQSTGKPGKQNFSFMTFSISQAIRVVETALSFWTKGLSADTQSHLGKSKSKRIHPCPFLNSMQVFVMIKDAEDPSILQPCLRVCAPKKIWLPQQTTLALPQVARSRDGDIHGKVRDVLLQSISMLHSLL